MLRVYAKSRIALRFSWRYPLQHLDTLSDRLGVNVHLKREDYQKILPSYGAYNMIKNLSEAQLKAGIITASAGNHAQGVAFDPPGSPGIMPLSCRPLLLI